MENKPGKPNNPLRRPVVRPATRPVGAPRPRPAASATPSTDDASVSPEAKVKPSRPAKIPKEKSESNVDAVKVILIILVILLAGSTGYLAYDKFTRPQAVVAEVPEEKPDPSTIKKSDIDSKVAEINKLEDSIRVIIAQKEKLGQELAAERSKIDELENLKTQIQNKELSINALNKRLFRFKKDFQTVQDSITFLAEENKKLVVENGTLQETLKAKEDTLKILHSVKSNLAEKVALASGLKAEHFVVTALTPSGKEIKEAPSYRAMVVGGVRVSFTFAENHLTEHGEKKVYFRFLEPGGGTILAGNKNFVVNGKNISYTDEQKFEFTNAEHTLTFNVAKPGKFTPGRYTLEFYTDGNRIGSTYLSLSK